MTCIHKLILAGLIAVGVLATVAAPAGAATGYANLCPILKTTFCTEGALEPHGIAVDNSNGASAGDIWVSNGQGGGGLNTLVEFNSSGNEIAEIDNSDLPPSAQPLQNLQYITVDPTSGAVYVQSNYLHGEGAVTKFSSSGAFQFQITASNLPEGTVFSPQGMAVDPSSGDLYIGSSQQSNSAVAAVYKFSPSGVYIEKLAIPAPIDGFYEGLAVDAQGRLYVAVSAGYANQAAEVQTPSHVSEYTAAGAPVDCPNGSNVLYENPEGTATFLRAPVAVDLANGHIVLGEYTGAEGVFTEYSAPCGQVLAILGAGEGATNGVAAVAVGDAAGRVYGLRSGASSGVIFGQVTVPDVTTATQATNVTRRTAQVAGTVNPDETSVTTCEFEYGPSAAYGESVPCDQSLPLEGNTPTTVSAELKFALPPATTVHYRLKSGNASGNNYGADQTFSSEPLPPPVVGGLPASEISQFTATFHGTLRTGEASVNYHFEYGTSTSYGSIAPIPDSYTPITEATITASQPVNGLIPATTYHYRLIASSPGGTEVSGPDETFTTLPVPAPAVATSGASDVGVGSATLTGSVDPQGWNTSYEFQYGTSMAYGSSWPTVPVELGAFQGAQAVTVSVANLLPGTTYHYRLLATDGGGTSYGPDMTFTTGEYLAPAIQEPAALSTLLVPVGGAAKLPGNAKKKSKGHKKARHHRPRAKTRGKRARAGGTGGVRRRG